MKSAMLLCAILATGPALAQSIETAEDVQLTEEQVRTIKKNVEQFADWGFGAGIGANISLEDKTRINDAQVINGKITITEDEDNTISPVLELHKFLWHL